MPPFAGPRSWRPRRGASAKESTGRARPSESVPPVQMADPARKAVPSRRPMPTHASLGRGRRPRGGKQRQHQLFRVSRGPLVFQTRQPKFGCVKIGCVKICVRARASAPGGATRSPSSSCRPPSGVASLASERNRRWEGWSRERWHCEVKLRVALVWVWVS